MATNKLSLFLYSNGNIAGSLLALAGLGLFFTGVIHVFWWAIVAGLYAIGLFAFPSRNPPPAVQRIELSAEHLAQQLHKMVEGVAPGLPKESLDCLRSIHATLTGLLPRLNELRERGVISPKDSFTVAETVRRYLPDTLRAYLRLPRLYAQMQPLADGRTASQTLLHQLKTLDTSLKEVARSAFAGDAEALVTNGEFLRHRFAEKPAFRR